MNDEHDPDRDDVTPDPDLNAEQDARIRALLAELGSGPDGEPIPAEVEARLDDTLAMLVAERGRTGAPDDHQDESKADNVVPMRPRWLPRAAVAAAAVIVLGAGGVVVASLGQMSQSGQNSASDSAGESKAEAPESGSDSEPGSDSESDSGTGAAALPELSASSFANDVAVLLEGRASLLTPEGAAADEQAPRENRDNAKTDAPGALTSQACPGPKVTDGAVPNLVRYDGRPAVLLIHPEQAGRQVVEAWNCAGNRKLASTTVTK